MCEIAVLDPEQAPIQAAHQIAAKFHEEQGDGLGVLAVHDDGESFSFREYKSTDPHWQTLYAFFRRNYDDAWRIVIHGRYGTAGETNRQNCHPLYVDCGECDFDYVVHNGSVRNHKSVRGGLASQGHDFNTPVDSEVIAHKVSELPETVEEHDRNTYSFRGNLNYLLFSTDGILVRVSQKYHLTDDFTMTCSYGEMKDAEDLGFEKGTDNEWMLIRPGGDIETKERQVWTHTGSSTTSSRRSGWAGAQSRGMRAAPQQGDKWRNSRGSTEDRTATDDTYTIDYKDLSDWDAIAVIQVAPGVLKVVDKHEGSQDFIKREKNPELYYWYSPESTPDNIDELQELAKEAQETVGSFVKQAHSDDTAEDEVLRDMIIKESTRAACKVTDMDLSDVADLQDEIRRNFEQGSVDAGA